MCDFFLHKAWLNSAAWTRVFAELALCSGTRVQFEVRKIRTGRLNLMLFGRTGVIGLSIIISQKLV